MHANEPYVLEALRNGAIAYVLKTTSILSLAEAVRAAIAGQRYLSPPLTERAIEAYLERANSASAEIDPYRMLTEREREVFQLSAEGLTYAEIGEKLNISPRTAETHRTHLMRKLRLHTETDLIRFAIQRGIIAGE
jgi:RNA polymerase sigma factor (sigma-70 family)